MESNDVKQKSDNWVSRSELQERYQSPMFAPLFLFGIGPLEIAIIVGIVLLLFGAEYVIPWVSRQTGEIAGAASQADEEFEAGREAE